MKRLTGVAGMLAVLSSGCSDKAEPKYAECVRLEAAGEVIGAWKACEDAVIADPHSKSGKSAAAMLKDMKPRHDAKQAEEAARQAAKEKEDAERRASEQRAAARIAKAKERVASMLVYEGATASGGTVVLRSEQCDQFGATVMGNALRRKIGDTDLVAAGFTRFECHHPVGNVFSMTYTNLSPVPESPTPTGVPEAAARRAGSTSLSPTTAETKPFGVQLSIPKEFNKVSERQDGLAFIESYATPGAAKLTVTKSYLNDEEPSFDALWAKATTPAAGMRITLKQKGKTWFVVSGFNGDLIFYTKVVVSGHQWGRFTITFAEDERPLYDPLLSPMERSLKIVDP